LAAIIALILQLVVANADINSQRLWARPSALAFLNTVRTEHFDQVLVLGQMLAAIARQSAQQAASERALMAP
jgi:hypothetical protein